MKKAMNIQKRIAEVTSDGADNNEKWRGELKSSHQGLLENSGKPTLLSQQHSGKCGLAVTRITTANLAVLKGNWETNYGAKDWEVLFFL